jgi:mycothiol synthase
VGSQPSSQVETTTRLAADVAAGVRSLVDEAAGADGVNPLSEHVLLHLRHGGDNDVRHLLARDGSRLLGYAHLDRTDPVGGPSAELVVHPEHRRRGVGRALVDALLAESSDGRLRLWAHGGHPGATALAERMGFRQARALWQLRRSLLAPLPTTVVPPDIDVRTFVVGQDEAAWVEVNNRAFADHPEQGGWSVEQVAVREQEPWFDPDGFFLAERDGRLVGFHWTKVHGGEAEGHAHPPMGEVYVVGVDPSARGLGLGRSLTVIGLQHLRGRGLTQAMLYVDETNRPAIRVYEDLGFAHWDTDVSYARVRSDGASTGAGGDTSGEP